MNLRDYQREAFRTRPDLLYDLHNNLHMILGIITESGELADVYKKLIAYDKQVDLVNVREELGDIMWYLVNFCTLNGIDLEDVLETNINKLKARYPDKFTAEAALNRNLEVERKVLEGTSKVELVNS